MPAPTEKCTARLKAVDPPTFGAGFLRWSCEGLVPFDDSLDEAERPQISTLTLQGNGVDSRGVVGGGGVDDGPCNRKEVLSHSAD